MLPFVFFFVCVFSHDAAAVADDFSLAQSRPIVSICILRIVIDFSTYIEYLKDSKHSFSIFYCAKSHGKVLRIGFDCMGNGREHDFCVESGIKKIYMHVHRVRLNE